MFQDKNRLKDFIEKSYPEEYEAAVNHTKLRETNGSLEKSIEYVKEITKLNDNIIGSNKLEITSISNILDGNYFGTVKNFLYDEMKELGLTNKKLDINTTTSNFKIRGFGAYNYDNVLYQDGKLHIVSFSQFTDDYINDHTLFPILFDNKFSTLDFNTTLVPSYHPGLVPDDSRIFSLWKDPKKVYDAKTTLETIEQLLMLLKIKDNDDYNSSLVAYTIKLFMYIFVPSAVDSSFNIMKETQELFGKLPKDPNKNFKKATNAIKNLNRKYSYAYESSIVLCCMLISCGSKDQSLSNKLFKYYTKYLKKISSNGIIYKKTMLKFYVKAYGSVWYKHTLYGLLIDILNDLNFHYDLNNSNGNANNIISVVTNVGYSRSSGTAYNVLVTFLSIFNNSELLSHNIQLSTENTIGINILSFIKNGIKEIDKSFRKKHIVGSKYFSLFVNHPEKVPAQIRNDIDYTDGGFISHAAILNEYSIEPEYFDTNSLEELIERVDLLYSYYNLSNISKSKYKKSFSSYIVSYDNLNLQDNNILLVSKLVLTNGYILSLTNKERVLSIKETIENKAVNLVFLNMVVELLNNFNSINTSTMGSQYLDYNGKIKLDLHGVNISFDYRSVLWYVILVENEIYPDQAEIFTEEKMMYKYQSKSLEKRDKSDEIEKFLSFSDLNKDIATYIENVSTIKNIDSYVFSALMKKYYKPLLNYYKNIKYK